MVSNLQSAQAGALWALVNLPAREFIRQGSRRSPIPFALLLSEALFEELCDFLLIQNPAQALAVCEDAQAADEHGRCRNKRAYQAGNSQRYAYQVIEASPEQVLPDNRGRAIRKCEQVGKSTQIIRDEGDVRGAARDLRAGTERDAHIGLRNAAGPRAPAAARS